MPKLEQIEIDRYRQQISDDVEKLVDKYRRIFDWDIPETDEPEAKRLILAAIRQAVDELG